MATIKLFEAWLQSQAINELGPAGGIDFSYIDQWNEGTALATKIEKDPVANMFYEKLKVMLKKNGIIFSCTPEKAAAYMTFWLVRNYGDLKQTADAWLVPQDTNKINLNASPDNPELVLTTGKFTDFEIQEPADDSQSSDYAEIAKFCNNSALVFLSESSYDTNKAGGYLLSTDANGSLTWKVANDYTMYLYGTSTTSSAMSKGTINTTTWEVPATGKTIVKTLPGTVFLTGQITLSNSKDVDAAVAELLNLKSDPNAVIAAIEIESSSSGDRPVDGVSGYPANTPAGKYPLGTPYIVKPTDTSGNAKLAKGRGETIKAKFSSFGITPTVKAVIQDGEDAAQYAKITITVNKKDKPTEVFSKSELETILLKPKSTTDLKSTFTLSQWKAATKL